MLLIEIKYWPNYKSLLFFSDIYITILVPFCNHLYNDLYNNFYLFQLLTSDITIVVPFYNHLYSDLYNNFQYFISPCLPFSVPYKWYNHLGPCQRVWTLLWLFQHRRPDNKTLFVSFIFYNFFLFFFFLSYIIIFYYYFSIVVLVIKHFLYNFIMFSN